MFDAKGSEVGRINAIISIDGKVAKRPEPLRFGPVQQLVHHARPANATVSRGYSRDRTPSEWVRSLPQGSRVTREADRARISNWAPA